MARPLPLLVALLALAALLPPVASEQGANPRDGNLATNGNLVQLAIAADRGSIAAVTRDPGAFPQDPDVSTWFLWDRDGVPFVSGSGDLADCETRVDTCTSDSVLVAISDDGRRIAVAANIPAPVVPVGDDLVRGQLLLITETQDIVVVATYEYPIIDLDFDAEGDSLALALRVPGSVGQTDDAEIHLYSWAGGGDNTFVELLDDTLDLPVTAIDLSGDGTRLVVAGEKHHRYVRGNPDPYVNSGIQGAVRAVAVADGLRHWSVAGYASGKVVLYSDQNPSAPEFNRQPTSVAITSVAMRRDASGNAIGYAAGDADGKVHLFGITAAASPPAALVSSVDLGDGAAGDLQFSKDGRYLTARTGSKVTFALVEEEGLRVLWTHTLAAAPVSLAMDGAGELLAVGSGTSITLFDASHELLVDGLEGITLPPRADRDLTSTYRNNGNRAEEVALQADYPVGWAVLLEPAAFSLLPGATQDVQVHLVAGETAAPGNYTLALVGTLAGVGEQRSEFNVTVPQVQRLVLEEDGATSLAIEPGAAVTFTFNVANLGNADDHAVLSATLSRNGWAAQLSATEVDVPAGEKVAVQLLLEAPANVAQGQSAQATVRLEGSPDEGLRFTGTVGGQFDPFLIAPSGIEIFPGNQTRFNLTVRNDGNAVDSFDLQLVGSLPSGWILGFENGQSTFVIRDIQPDESATTMATLRIPVTAALDEVRPIVIQAVSLGDRTAHHERTVLANVEAPPENGGGSGKDSPGLPLPLLLVAVVAALAMGRRRRES